MGRTIRIFAHGHYRFQPSARNNHGRVARVCIRRLQSCATPILDERHDHPHVVGDDIVWNESWYFNAYTPASVSNDAARAASVGSLASGHLEQAGRWSGWIEVDGARVSIDGRGNRDKSWGPRKIDGSRELTMWRWFSVHVGDDFHLGGLRMGTVAGDLHRGWIWRGGEATSVRRWDVRTETAADRRAPTGANTGRRPGPSRPPPVIPSHFTRLEDGGGGN